MSQARIEYVKKSRKAQKPCEKCREELPVGSAYLYFYVGFRSNYKRVRCMKTECFPTRGERESSLLGEVYDAQDNAEKTIQEAESWDDIKLALDEVAEACRNVASQYEEASTDENGNTFNQDAADRAEILERAADDIEDIDKEDVTMECETCSGKGSIEVPDPGDSEFTNDEECSECDGDGTVVDLDTMRDDAISDMTGVELP